MAVVPPSFDIFSGTPEIDPIWICQVEGLASAKEQMDRIAAEKPGNYFVVLLATQEILARTRTSAMPQGTLLRDPQLPVSLEILAKTGHAVGEVTEIDGEPYVAIDGKARTYEQVFELVAEYNRKRAADA